MKILAFDTSTSACSAALSINGEIRERFEIAPQRHAELILPMIDSLLIESDISLRQLDAIAVGQGPGSFMGVRIAIGVAQGIGFGVALPLIPISSLQILAETAYQQTGDFQQMMVAWDARMNAVYWGKYHRDQELMVPMIADALNAPQELILPQESDWLLVGNGWETYRQFIPELDKTQLNILNIYPRASAMLPLAEFYFQNNRVCTPLEIEPVYLRNKVTSRHSQLFDPANNN